MKPFRFSLQVLRTLREQKEQAAQQRFAAALRTRDEAAARLGNCEIELRAVWREMKALCQSGATATDLVRRQEYANWLEQRHLLLEKEWRAAQDALEQARTEMRNAMRDREALEQLHRRRRRAHELEVLREEQKQLDEMAGRDAGPTISWQAELNPAEALL